MKSCPFCGESEVKMVQETHVYYVVCYGCAAEGPVADDKEEAEELWNERKI